MENFSFIVARRAEWSAENIRKFYPMAKDPVKETLKAHVAAIKETVEGHVTAALEAGEKALAKHTKNLGADLVRNLKALHKTEA